MTLIVSFWAVWTAFINTESARGLSDTVLTLVPVCTASIGFAFGFFDYGRLAGVMLLALEGGLSFAMRLMLFGPNLTVPVNHLYGDWLIIAAFGVFGLFVLLDKRGEGFVSPFSFLLQTKADRSVKYVSKKSISRSLVSQFERDRT